MWDIIELNLPPKSITGQVINSVCYYCQCMLGKLNDIQMKFNKS